MSWRRTRTQPTNAQRRRILTRDPLCRLRYPGVCTVWSTEVDHIRAGTTGHVPDHMLQGVCRPCHRVKTSRDIAASNRRRTRPDTQRPPHPGRREGWGVTPRAPFSSGTVGGSRSGRLRRRFLEER